MTEYDLPVDKQGKYLIIDTTHKSDQGVFFDEMSGDKGDAGRKVYLAIKERARSNDPKDPLMPMDLTGKDVRFQGHDAEGMWKRIALATKIENAKAGLVEITLPRYIYQAVGPYQNGEFEIFETKGGANVSTVRVGFEVYDNGAHLTAGESVHYSDEFEALMKEFKDSMYQSIEDVKKEIDSANGTASAVVSAMKTTKTQMDAWELKVTTLISDWEKLLAKSGAVTPTGDFVLEGQISAMKTILGFTTGNAVTFYGDKQDVQDLNDVASLRSMKSFTTKHEYFSNNAPLNNPMPGEMFYLETTKVSTETIFQRVIRVDSGDNGLVKTRRITGLSGTPRLGRWGIEAQWGPMTSFVDKLTGDFKPYFANGSLPMFQFNGNSVHIRGQVAPTRKITPERHDEKILIAKNLPFNSQTSQRLLQTWSGPIPYTLRLEGNELWMERVYHADGSKVTLDTGHMFTFGGDFLLN